MNCLDCAAPLVRGVGRRCAPCQTKRVHERMEAWAQRDVDMQTGRQLNRLLQRVPVCAACCNPRFNFTCFRCAPLTKGPE